MPITLADAIVSVRTNLRATETILKESEIIDLINQAIDMASSEGIIVPVSDETLDQVEGQYEYPLDDGDSDSAPNLEKFRYIYDLYMETETAGLFEERPLPHAYWSVQESTIPYILFPRHYWTPEGGVGIRILGGISQPRTSALDDEILLPPAYVVWLASAYGHSLLSGFGSPALQQWHSRSIGYAEQNAEKARLGAMDYRIPPTAIRVPGRF